MSELLIIIIPSLIAIVVMVLLIRVTGIARPVVLNDETQVRETINEHYEGEEIDHIVLSNDGQCALAFMKNGAPTLVRALGDRMAVRRLNARTIATLSGHDETLDLKLNDFTWPRTSLVFDDAAARHDAEKAINNAAQEPAHA